MRRAIVLLRRQRAVMGLKVVRRLPSSGPGFLTLDRFLVRNVYADGRTSPPYRSEVLHRRGIDAVAIVPFYFADRPRKMMVICKTGFRPGLSTRAGLKLPVRDRRAYLTIIEAVAGSLEPGDRGEKGVSARARAELLEETGLKPIGGRMIRLGSGFFPSHGQSTEKIHLRAFQVDPRRQVAEAGDGSVNEADSGTIAIEAGRILEMCRRGLIEDPKLEIGVSRLLRLKNCPPANSH
jgi:ADP-ribose pyrophosphatase